MSKRIMVAMGLWLAAAGTAASAGKDGVPPGSSPADEIHQWIVDLDSDLFAVRQAASRNLREAGRPAIEPLMAAANGLRSEVTRRAVELLEAFCDADELETADAARAALENLARSSHRLPAQRASLVLRGQRLRQQRMALAQIQRLGGSVTYAAVEEGELVVGKLVLGRKWEAGNEGLKYLAKLGRVEQLNLYGAQFTDEGLEQLSQLIGVQRLKLYATRISDDGQVRLQQALPGTEVDRRYGALLGVSGSGDAKGCLVTLVREETAAARAGIEREDVITQVNGEPIPDMATLVATIAKQRPGDRIKVTLLRGDQTLSKDIVLGELSEEIE